MFAFPEALAVKSGSRELLLGLKQQPLKAQRSSGSPGDGGAGQQCPSAVSGVHDANLTLGFPTRSPS